MEKQEHWENIYATKKPTDVSWFRAHLEKSLTMIDAANLSADAAIIDIGGGASTLVDDLLDEGFKNITVLDISENALDKSRERLGDKVASVNWVAADVTQLALPENHFDLWHDRAVFHFLIEEDDRKLYLENLRRSLKSGGHFVIATFAEDGALKCSGLIIERYSIEKMIETLGDDFELLETFREEHRTPFDTTQNFLYAHFRLKK